MASAFILPKQTVVNGSGVPYAGAKLYLYQANTTTPIAVYTTPALDVPAPNPLTANDAGRFDAVYVDTSVYESVGYELRTAAGTFIESLPDVPVRDLTAEVIGVTLYPSSAAEQAVGVTPTAYRYGYGERPRYASLADAVAVSDAHPLNLYASETITASITLPTGAQITGHNRPLITNSTSGAHVFDATSKANISISGVRFKGNSASTVPSTGFGGYAAANTGLVTITTCTDVRVQDCEFDTFYNGLTVQNCDRVWIERNRARNFQIHGILAGASTQFVIERNVVTDCTQTGAAVAYGIHATGDQAGGNTQKQCSISYNMIDGVPSWDGIMCHDVDGLRVVGNDIRNVRQGIDIGHLVATNVVRNIDVSGNYIESTATNTWGGSAAQHAGIAIAGYDATNRLSGVTVRGNIIRNFFTTSGMVGGGDPNNVIISNADDVAVVGNVVINAGAIINNAGIGIGGTINRLTVSGNNLQGSMARGGIRLASVTGDVVSITGNTIKQTTSSVEAILFSSCTISALGLGGNTTNSTSPVSNSSSTLTMAGEVYEGSATYDPPSLADGAGTTTTVTVTGAAVGDFAMASFGGDTQGMTITAWVSAANTVSVRLQNESTGTLDIGSATLRARVLKRVT